MIIQGSNQSWNKINNIMLNSTYKSNLTEFQNTLSKEVKLNLLYPISNVVIGFEAGTKLLFDKERLKVINLLHLLGSILCPKL